MMGTTADFDVVVAGGGTAGCVLAARLSEEPARTVCVVEAGPDYGPFDEGRWPVDMADAGILPHSHDWGAGGEDQRSLGARILGGSSAHNACMAVRGTPADYDAWGPGWTYAELAPFLQRARAELRTAPANTERPAPLHVAFLQAAQAAGVPALAPDTFDDGVGVGAFPANAVDGVRWNTAFAYLDGARSRPNLSVVAHALVDRVVFDGTRAAGVRLQDGRQLGASTVVLAAGAYFTPAILARSGIGPAADVAALGRAVVVELPVGERLLDHVGTGLAFEPSEALHAATTAHLAGGRLCEPHVMLKHASSVCPPGSFDLHLLSWADAATEPGRYDAGIGVFLLAARSHGRVRIVSADPDALPLVERGHLSCEDDLVPLLEGLELGRRLAATEPLRGLLAGERRPGSIPLRDWIRQSARNYFHPAGTCPIGPVVDRGCRVHGVEGLLVADASVMPEIPRANTNLTTVAIAERVAGFLTA